MRVHTLNKAWLKIYFRLNLKYPDKPNWILIVVKDEKEYADYLNIIVDIGKELGAEITTPEVLKYNINTECSAKEWERGKCKIFPETYGVLLMSNNVHDCMLRNFLIKHLKWRNPK